MSHEQPTTHDSTAEDTIAAQDTVVREPAPPSAYQPIEEQDEWLDEPLELPRRPRRRLLSPVPLALLGVLLIACGFIGGVLVEKGETSSSSSTGATSALASRFAALRGGGASTGASGAAAGAAAAFGAGKATAGSVSYLDGSTLYVTTTEGNTVKVTTSDATTVTKTVKADVKGIHPGETVTVTGATGSSGAVSAESIRVGASGGGIGSLFSGSGGSGGSSGKAGSSSTGGGEPALFGSGG